MPDCQFAEKLEASGEGETSDWEKEPLPDQLSQQAGLRLGWI